MADWNGTCRSNYFRVKDVEAFKTFLADFEVAMIANEDGVGFVSEDEYGGIPSFLPEDDDQDMVSILGSIHEHLAEGSICIIIEAGAERARYITGQAIAIDHTGDQVSIDLFDIYELAKKRFGETAIITEATY